MNKLSLALYYRSHRRNVAIFMIIIIFNLYIYLKNNYRFREKNKLK